MWDGNQSGCNPTATWDFSIRIVSGYNLDWPQMGMAEYVMNADLIHNFAQCECTHR